MPTGGWSTMSSPTGSWMMACSGRGAIRLPRSYGDRWRRSQHPTAPAPPGQRGSVRRPNIVLARSELRGPPWRALHQHLRGCLWRNFSGGTSVLQAPVQPLWNSMIRSQVIVSSLYWLRQTDGHWVRYNDSADVHSMPCPSLSSAEASRSPCRSLADQLHHHHGVRLRPDPVTGKRARFLP